jgi:hypothetical protein
MEGKADLPVYLLGLCVQATIVKAKLNNLIDFGKNSVLNR